MYEPDLSTRARVVEETEEIFTFVGWLSKSHSFKQGFVDTEILGKILWLCVRPSFRTRGWHSCEFCSPPTPRGVKYFVKGSPVYLGDAEIIIKSGAGINYCAPTLIYHYIHEHNYQPPSEFLNAVDEAVSTSIHPDQPSSKEKFIQWFQNLLRKK